jgi:hypothetical protein
MSGRVRILYHLFAHVFYCFPGYFRGKNVGLTDVEVVYLTPFALGLFGIGDQLPDRGGRHLLSFG